MASEIPINISENVLSIFTLEDFSFQNFSYLSFTLWTNPLVYGLGPILQGSVKTQDEQELGLATESGDAFLPLGLQSFIAQAAQATAAVLDQLSIATTSLPFGMQKMGNKVFSCHLVSKCACLVRILHCS